MLESILWNKVKEDASLEVWGNLVSFCACSQLGQLNGSFALSVKTPNSGVHQKAVSMGRSPRSGQETKQVPSPSPQPAAASTGNTVHGGNKFRDFLPLSSPESDWKELRDCTSELLPLLLPAKQVTSPGSSTPLSSRTAREKAEMTLVTLCIFPALSPARVHFLGCFHLLREKNLATQ